jgi:DNA processing protein
MAELEALLALNRTGLVGPILIARLRRVFGSLKAATAASAGDLAGVPGVGEAVARAIRRSVDTGAGAIEIEAAARAGCRILAAGEEGYPAQLLSTVDHPPVLYLRGEIRPEDRLSIAFVGSRSPSEYGRRMSGRLAGALAELGVTVVSGLARGIDAEAHRAALDHGRTLAVLGCGLGRIYPPEHRVLADRVAARGALLSEFAMGEPPRTSNFPRRNRIISGLALGTVCVEASPTSGALVTCAWALEQGREVFAVPGAADHPLSRGPHELIRQGAKVVEDPLDILEEIAEFGPVVEKLRLREPRDPLQRLVWAAIRDGATGGAAIRRATGMGDDTVARLVGELLKAGLLIRVGGALKTSGGR